MYGYDGFSSLSNCCAFLKDDSATYDDIEFKYIRATIKCNSKGQFGEQTFIQKVNNGVYMHMFNNLMIFTSKGEKFDYQTQSNQQLGDGLTNGGQINFITGQFIRFVNTTLDDNDIVKSSTLVSTTFPATKLTGGFNAGFTDNSVYVDVSKAKGETQVLDAFFDATTYNPKYIEGSRYTNTPTSITINLTPPGQVADGAWITFDTPQDIYEPETIKKIALVFCLGQDSCTALPGIPVGAEKYISI